MKSKTRWWFATEEEKERELHLEVLEIYAETGDANLLRELREVHVLDKDIRGSGLNL